MAQTIKLKRSSTPGKVPTTSQLALGEIAINTHDGRIFFEKNDGAATIEHIVTTDSITSGSIELTGTVTANTLTVNSLFSQNSETTTLMINGSGVVGIRELGSNAFNSTSFLTEHPNITPGSNISEDNSNGTVLQDLTITLDSNGHVTTATAGTVNLDGRYYTETESDTLYTKKLGQGVVSGSSQVLDILTSLNSATGSYVLTTGTQTIGGNKTFSGNSQFNGTTQFGGDIDVTNAAVFDNTVEFSNLTSSADTTAVMLGSDNEITKRTLGSNAFTSTTITPDGGNADQVDGLHASSFIRSDANDTATGNITFEGTVDVDSQFNAGANIVPQTDNIGEVGTAALTFNNGRFTNFTVDSTLDANIITADTMSISAHLSLDDNDEIRLGSGDDFVIEDDGTNTLFKSTRHGGEVYFQNENASGTNQNTLILGTDTSYTDRTYVELRYNNVERIRTTVDGSRLAGVVNFDGTTQSTAKTNGTVIIDGGVGIAKTLNVGEDVVAYASSDERYKDLITPIENPNEKIKLLSGNTFVWNDKHEVFKGKKDIGVIAQEVEKVLPEIVETRDNGYKAVKYEKIVALLIESNKELIKRVEELESKIK